MSSRRADAAPDQPRIPSESHAHAGLILLPHAQPRSNVSMKIRERKKDSTAGFSLIRNFLQKLPASPQNAISNPTALNAMGQAD
jgi:hypothetical protein